MMMLASVEIEGATDDILYCDIQAACQRAAVSSHRAFTTLLLLPTLRSRDHDLDWHHFTPRVVSPTTSDNKSGLDTPGSIALSSQDSVVLHGLTEPVVKVRDHIVFFVARAYHVTLTISWISKHPLSEEGLAMLAKDASKEPRM